MLLGLELTYPINRLKIKLEKLENEVGNLRISQKLQTENTENPKKDIPKIEGKITQLKKEIENLKQNSKNNELLKQLEKEYNT